MEEAYVVYVEGVVNITQFDHHGERDFMYIVLNKNYLEDCIGKVKKMYAPENLVGKEIKYEKVHLYDDEANRNAYGYVVLRYSKDYADNQKRNKIVCITKSAVEALTQIGKDRDATLNYLKFKVDTSVISPFDIVSVGLNDTYDFIRLTIFTSYDAAYSKYFASNDKYISKTEV